MCDNVVCERVVRERQRVRELCVEKFCEKLCVCERVVCDNLRVNQLCVKGCAWKSCVEVCVFKICCVCVRAKPRVKG